MVVTDPLKVTITNFPSTDPIELTVPNFPADESRGSHKIKFDSVIYIEKSDFNEVRSFSLKLMFTIKVIIIYDSSETCFVHSVLFFKNVNNIEV